MTRRIQVAVITGAHGIKGQVTIHSLIDAAALADMPVFSDESGTRTFSVRFTGHKKNLLIATIKDVVDRNAAELLRGTKLYVDENESALPEETKMLDLPAKLADGSHYGIVTGIYDFGAGDVVEIKRTDGTDEMLPFTKAFVKQEKDHIVITPPQYLEAGKK